MFFSKKLIVAVFVFALISAAAAFVLYYANTSALNAPQQYRGVFI